MEPTAIPAELEAKLLVQRDSDLDALARLTRLGTYRLQPRPPQVLHSVYLDTADLVLARHGIAVRTRRCGEQWEATIKWAGTVDGMVHERLELTVPLAAAPAARPKIAPALFVHLAARLAGRQLRPVLVTEIERRAIDVWDESATRYLAEIALDRVVLRSPSRRDKRSDRYGEVEIERKDGSVDDVVAITALLRRGRALHPSSTTKLSRGLELLFGRVDSAAAPAALAPHDSLGTAARKLVAHHLARLVEADPGTRLGVDPEAVHDMRVACRRLRAVLRIFGAAFPGSLQARLRRDFRWLGQVLGHMRDVDVQLQKVQAFAAHRRGRHRTELQPYVEFLRRLREACRPPLLAHLESRRYFQLLRQLEAFVVSAPIEADLQPLAVAGAHAVRRAFRRLHRQASRVAEQPSADDLHAVRIRAKRVRYSCELLRPLTGTAGRRFVRRMVGLQDLLGTHNDAVVATAFARRCLDENGLDDRSRAAIEAFIHTNEKHAARARAEFHRTWRRFHKRKTDRGLEAVLQRLGVG